ncbi:MAG: carbamate kinase [Ezakiella sp.]|nr:carbamate kinase [Ezakiella sp.]MDD7472145.1 carbamate kinase [Bacillota bacterium]MDY3923488.1 carbamate kinase [Ezakiella sp.]
MSRILISLGGNALGTLENDLKKSVETIAGPICDLIKDGNEVVICHGNGPQVGYIKSNIDRGAKLDNTETLPLSSCVAMSQSFIGAELQSAIDNKLLKMGLNTKVAVVVTHVLVDENDKNFKNPTKPIGAFYSETEAKELEKQGKTMIEDSGRGYREVVASPIPVEIVEKDILRTMADNGILLIAGGGGGIPTIKGENGYNSIDAVIDKDRTSLLLASDTNCDSLVIITGVEKVSINFNKPNQQDLSRMTLEECEKYIAEGQFPAGSMLPKIEAAMEFVKQKEGRQTLITSLDKLVEGMRGNTGTLIVHD